MLPEYDVETVMKELRAQFKSTEKWSQFQAHVEHHGADLHRLLWSIYGTREDFYDTFIDMLQLAYYSWLARSDGLHALDASREANPTWFQSNTMVGAVCFVDLYAGNLIGLGKKLAYFKQLGITYLHLMPLFRAPDPNSDGGYAVSSYREVDSKLGTMIELTALADAFRAEGISLCVDFIFNHTSNEHEWAMRARSGDSDFKNYYFIFPDRRTPEAYEKNLREIFPNQHPGSFTEHLIDGKREWVWTTFKSYQWDLNYANPKVLAAMAGERLSIANVGIEVLRMDAVAFIWKQEGTT